MNAFADIVNYISTTVIGVYSLLIVLRFVFQWAKADFFNPISQGIVKATSPALMPFRKIIPGFAGLDIAALVLALLLNLVSLIITTLLSGANLLDASLVIFIAALLKTLATLINIASFSLIGGIILSFAAPMSSNPMALLINQVSATLSAPFRKILPDLGPIDISPIFVFLAIGVLTKLLALIGMQFGIMVGSVWLFVIVA
ncbi:MAG: YggT family protein [Sinobacterium sp.]|nr:YggT family protein [Sinobacterium sp.]